MRCGFGSRVSVWLDGDRWGSSEPFPQGRPCECAEEQRNETSFPRGVGEQPRGGHAQPRFEFVHGTFGLREAYPVLLPVKFDGLDLPAGEQRLGDGSIWEGNLGRGLWGRTVGGFKAAQLSKQLLDGSLGFRESGASPFPVELDRADFVPGEDHALDLVDIADGVGIFHATKRISGMSPAPIGKDFLASDGPAGIAGEKENDLGDILRLQELRDTLRAPDLALDRWGDELL